MRDFFRLRINNFCDSKFIYEIKKILSKYIYRWIIAGIICLICMIILYLSRPIFFHLHDTNMMKTYSGYRTGIPTSEHTYGNMIYGHIMFTLYSLTDKIPWYSIVVIGCLLVALTAILKSILTIAYYKKRSFLHAFILFSFIFLGIFLYSYAFMLFTVNAAIICCSGISLIYSSFVEEKIRNKNLDFLLSIILMIIGSIFRVSSFKPCFCFWAIAILTCFFYKECGNIRKKYKEFFVLIFVIFATYGIVYAGAQTSIYLRNIETPENFDVLNDYRAKFMDYKTIEYIGNEEFYSSIGWSMSFYDLVKNSYFMDENYNIDNLVAIYDYSVEQSNINNNLKDILKLGYEVTIKDNYAFIFTFALFISFIWLVLKIVLYNKLNKSLLLFMCMVPPLLCVLLSFYLCWSARFLTRTYQCIVYPTIMVLIFNSFIIDKNNYVKAPLAKYLDILFVVLIILIDLLSINYTFDNKIVTQYQFYNDRFSSMVDYAFTHKDNIYIYDVTVSSDHRVLIDPSQKNCLNLILWGGTNMYTTSYYNQLNLLNKTEITTDNFFDDNVYYLTNSKNEYLNLLKKYLYEKYGEVVFVLIEKLDTGVCIYKIKKN